ncbi:hypothetical protein PC116_g29062 [Phytophthora cactorum]|nr:hypothetical protein PC116_g29062 [Phytophthora cactorum]
MRSFAVSLGLMSRWRSFLIFIAAATFFSSTSCISFLFLLFPAQCLRFELMPFAFKLTKPTKG